MSTLVTVVVTVRHVWLSSVKFF